MSAQSQDALLKTLMKGISYTPAQRKKFMPHLNTKPETVEGDSGNESADKEANSDQNDNQTTKKTKKISAHKQFKIKTDGNDVPSLVTSFDQLKAVHRVRDCIVENLYSQGYLSPTPVQMQVWPLMLEGRDLLAAAPTGSGKTAAFLLPLLHCLGRPRAKGFRAVVVCHTRELAQQILREARVLSEGTGLKIHLIDEVKKIADKFGPKSSGKFDILISTPHRLSYMIRKQMVAMTSVEWLVMDECDRLFEDGKNGFKTELGIIYRACNGPKVHRALFSATFAEDLKAWCRDNMNDCIKVVIGTKNTCSSDVDQRLVFCGDEETGKICALKNIIREGYEPPCLIFVQTKERAKQLFAELAMEDILMDAIHADRSQKQREAAVEAFREKKLMMLICTELMSRGIDFKGVNLVINFDIPSCVKAYIHCIGRTGRAGRRGRAVTFWTKEDVYLMGAIARNIKMSGGEVGDWMTKIQAPRNKLVKTKKYVSVLAKFDKIEEVNNSLRKVTTELAKMKGTPGFKKTQQCRDLKQRMHRLVTERKAIGKEEEEKAKVEDDKIRATKRKRMDNANKNRGMQEPKDKKIKK